MVGPAGSGQGVGRCRRTCHRRAKVGFAGTGARHSGFSVCGARKPDVTAG